MEKKELLEFAAKAAGLDLARWDEERDCIYHPFRSPLQDGHEWDPWEDDGDALRLAAHLQIDLEFQAGIATVLAIAPKQRGCAADWRVGGNMAGAVRTAITRAAAALGRSM